MKSLAPVCRGWIILCSSVMIITSCVRPAARDKALLEKHDRLSILNQALFDAVEKGQTDHVRDLVQQGTDVDVRGIAGKDTPYPSKNWTPLLVAADKGYTKIALILLENGADIYAQNGQDYGFRTPLHHAAKKGHVDIIKMLLAKGADVHASSSHDYWTPLHAATYDGQTTAALILLKAGADPFIRNIQGATPLDYAKEKGLNTVVKFIETLPQR